MAEKVLKHRNTLLLIVLLGTLAISCLATIRRLEAENAGVTLPVSTTTGAVQTPLNAFKAERDEKSAADMAALQALVETETLDQDTRESAAGQLQAMIDRRERQLALEGALTQSGLSPCVAVITDGSVTIVTEKAALTAGEQTLVMTLAQAHAGIAPSGVRVITGEKQ